MTADDVLDALTLRWPDDAYLSIDEAPQQANRGGRKLDRLVVSLWRSRGLQLDGVEVKVSYSDWTRERKTPEKADWWWQHVHRFWVAVPAGLVERVRPELPPTWGLLSCSPGAKPEVAVKAPEHDPEPLPWGATVGIMRAAADCGVNALYRAEARGREEGVRQGIEKAERRSSEGWAQKQLASLKERVEAFERASGLDITNGWNGGERVGRLVKLVQDELKDPGHLTSQIKGTVNALKRQAEHTVKQAENMEAFADDLTAALAPPPECEVENEEAA